MKNAKVTIVAIISFLAVVLSPAIVEAATLKAPKISVKEETYYDTQTAIEVGYVKDTSTYRIYRSSDNKNFKKVKTLSVEGIWTDTETIPGTTYYYKVKACNKKGKCSKYSKVVSKTAILNAPSDLRVMDVGNVIGISWRGDKDATGYDIERSTDGKKWKKVTTNKGADNTYYYDSNVKEGKTYYYRIRAYKKIEGSKTKKTSKSQIKVKNSLPKILYLNAVASDNGLLLNWASDAGELMFEIKRSDSKDGKYTTIANDYGYNYSSNNIYYFLDGNLKKNKTYYYKVRYYYYDNKGNKKYGKTFKLTAKTLTTGKAKKAAVNLTKNIINHTEMFDNNNYYYYGYQENGYSKKDVISKLQYRYGFSENVAKYGAENASINYKKQALKTANNTIESKKGLKKELDYTTFTKKEKEYALNKTKVNFNTNARLYRKDALNEYGISKATLTEDLQFAEFKPEQIKNATKNVDYKLQALQKAETMLDNHYYTKTSLKNALINYEGFTKPEAEYAVKNGKFDYVKKATEYLKKESNESYGGYNAYGKSKLVSILVDEGFSKSDAKKIVNNAKLNYNKQAEKRVRDLTLYSYEPHSENELKVELIDNYGFTTTEASYGISKNKINFNEQALKFVNNRLNQSFTYYSRYEMTNELKLYGYTNNNIKYALNNSSAASWQQNANEYVQKLVYNYNIYQNNGYSKAELIKTMTSSNVAFTKQETETAINSANIDYKYQAILFANHIYDLGNFKLSYKEFIAKLESQGFTKEEATYGVDNSGADYKMAASVAARDIYNAGNFKLSRVGFIAELESKGFTNEQATYGVDSQSINYTNVLVNLINEIEARFAANGGPDDTYQNYYNYFSTTLGFTVSEVSTAFMMTGFSTNWD